MKLDDWLKKKNIMRSAFAAQIDVVPGYITALCNGTSWPSRTIAKRIAEATKGKVTANDFLNQQ